MKDKYFYVEESPFGYKLIKLDSSKVPGFQHKGGTMGAIEAALYGLSYANYCRMCRDKYGATLKGKTGYPIICWDKVPQELLLSLDARIDRYIKYREKIEGNDDCADM